MCAARGHAARILIASADMALAQLRKRVIEQESGWIVTVSRNKQHALALLHSEEFDVLLLCNSVSHKTRLDFAVKFRQRNAQGKIVVFEGRAHSQIDYDVLLQVPVSPRELMAALHRLLNARSQTETEG
jgi:DNA-binding response OmpR family regulator